MNKPKTPLLKSHSDIYFARHGRSKANEEGYLAGSSDSELVGAGWQQAYDLAEHVHESGIEFSTIISSPLRRAFGTAGMVASRLGMDPREIVVIDELRERSGGSFEGGPLDTFYGASDLEVAAAGGESLEAFAVRMLQAQRKIEQTVAKRGGPTLVVAHAEGKRMLDTIAVGLPVDTMPRFDKPPNAQLQPFFQIPHNTIYVPYYTHKGIVSEKPRDGWVRTDIKPNERGEFLELAEVPVGSDSDLQRGDKVFVGVDNRGSQFNQLAKVRKQSKLRRLTGHH